MRRSNGKGPLRFGGPIPAIEQAIVLHERGRLDEAARMYETILKADPNASVALRNLGAIRIQEGKPDDAQRLLRKAVNREPRSADAHNNLGIALQMLGRDAEAIGRYEKVVALAPGHVGAWGSLGLAYRATGLNDKGIACFRRLCELAPDNVNGPLNLGRALHAVARYEEAIACFERALALAPDHVDTLIALATTLEAADRPELAIAHLRRALSLDADNAAALSGLGLELTTVGRLDEARRVFEQAVTVAPARGASYLNLADAKRFTADDPHIAAMEALLRDAGSTAKEDALFLHFALAKAYADLDRHDDSFRHLVEANARKRKTVVYDDAAAIEALGRIPTLFTPALIREKAGLGDPSRVPVFIVGMPRSGSTLIEQILSSHPAVFGAGERKDFTAAVMANATMAPAQITDLSTTHLRALGASYLEHILPLAPTAQRITDKLPGNFKFLGLIHLALPNARIIHTRRNPIDTCLSCFSILFRDDQPFTYDLAELGHYYRAYAALMDHWRRSLPTGVLLEVQYEDVVADIEQQARRIIAHCGLEWDDACLAFHQTQRAVRTASHAQVRQPIYASAVGRWRAYGKMLKPLFDALEIELPADAT